MIKPHDIMKECVQLALLGKGYTKTNPIVGAIIVKDGKIIGRGYHEEYGKSHAEINAMNDAVEPLEGADLYVTLEPCSIHGKTPPCVDAIIENKIKRVFIGVVDPNPKIAGQGIIKLIEAGVEVFVGFDEELCASIIEDFTKGVLNQEPYYTLKLAQSLDGKIATKTGDSKWITSESSRVYVHYIRSVSDAILVGVNTVNRDNPRLDVRLIKAEVNPYKVVLDPFFEIDTNSFLCKNYSNKLILFVKDIKSKEKYDKLISEGVEIVKDESIGELFDLNFISKYLYSKNILNVLIEGGSETAGRFIDAGKVDKVLFFIAPKIIGGRDAVSSIKGDGVEKIQDAIEVKMAEVKHFDNDILISGKIKDYTEYVIKLTDKVRNRCLLGL
ncbi:bifunctional riboflavin biosynthesis protein RibD [Deferribacter desulfuricans SSM1]|uniref:Riboflavin biosynthesis protein RibD n=1 Tax=Deferribacter desulfuricans (strain DSM 14783 / JCM 11476 / NBRC 101012 / SSM1) TaxID=639282 RepID=D3PD92_DEFDS|nr:bifunctional diaminohydroxyphosphoribosylaminopyrimidine deaminase/5-amino-6-(5-phosphoribosylamino)uracil reductase RibD [Deferribacter desulfuricans]BAI80565.1 bifunctional riboflavin biosynthesis protein RibD [Deferribacter desulfuricans SSM1]